MNFFYKLMHYYFYCIILHCISNTFDVYNLCLFILVHSTRRKPEGIRRSLCLSQTWAVAFHYFIYIKVLVQQHIHIIPNISSYKFNYFFRSYILTIVKALVCVLAPVNVLISNKGIILFIYEKYKILLKKNKFKTAGNHANAF